MAGLNLRKKNAYNFECGQKNGRIDYKTATESLDVSHVFP